MYESERDFQKHERHEYEQYETLPRQLIDLLEDFDHIFRPQIESKESKTPQQIYELKKEYENKLEEFLTLATSKSSEDMVLDAAVTKFRTVGKAMNSLLDELIKRDQLSTIDIEKWDTEQELFSKQATSLREALTGTTPPDGN